MGPVSYQRFSSALQYLTELKNEQLALKDTKQQLEQLLTHGLAIGVLTVSTQLQQALQALQATNTWMQQLVSINTELTHASISPMCTFTAFRDSTA